VLLFSKRDDEAAELLGFRLPEMYLRLPAWMRSKLTADTAHKMEFPSGSRVLAFATTGGRSYTATLAIIDEADHVPDLEAMLNAVKPTVDAGGRLILLSTADKWQPESTFKNIYRAARQKQNNYHPIFLPWGARPDRTPAWYDDQRRTVLAQTGAPLDDLHQEYPATDVEALSPRSLDKRIPAAWLQRCYAEAAPIYAPGAPAVPGLAVYALPAAGRKYVIGMDPAEGNPTSDDSALCVIDKETGEQVAELAGRFEPSVFAFYGYQISRYFNKAAFFVERNNHGHAVLLWFRVHARDAKLLHGHDGNAGWLSSALGKTKLYDAAADALKNGEAAIHSFATFTQLASIEGNTLGRCRLAAAQGHPRGGTVTLL
jgi:hypothetical protein